MIQRVLIANRGEIARRVVRTCRRLGIETVVAVSEADRSGLAAREADRAVCIGPPPSSLSYLRHDAVITAAQMTGCDAIHPGYGFLAESADFARTCAEEGLTFVGPDPETLHTFGDKVQARRLAESAGVPLLPGSGLLSTIDDALARAEELGYPVLLKPSLGGGGKGMRVVRDPDEMRTAFLTSAGESEAAFGSASLFLERWIGQARHVEVQIAGDGSGATIHIGDRDCSVQRRQQKLVEEAPAPFLSEATHDRLRQAAVDLAAGVRYNTVGTVEFLVDPADESFYFLEMNPRIQVEHGVTELVSGLDLVEIQLRTAARAGGLPDQADIRLDGAAIECRINAENPHLGFRPSPGRVTGWAAPSGAGVRVDTYLEEGAVVPPFYDSLAAKVMVHADDRAGAIAGMLGALGELRIEGIDTTTDLASWIVGSEEFAAMDVYTRWLDEAVDRFAQPTQALEAS